MTSMGRLTHRSPRGAGAGLLAVAALLLAPAAAQAKWLRAESAHFVVYSDSSESGLRTYAEDLEEFDRLLRRFHNNLPDDSVAPKLEIYMVDGSEELRQVFPEMGRATAGVYTADQDGVFAVAFKPSIYGDMVVKHEYYHHFMMQNFPGGYPAWLTEGLAVYFSTATKIMGKMAVGSASGGELAQLSERAWIPFGELIAKPVSQVPDISRGLYYSEAWLATNYMMADAARRTQLATYVGLVRAGLAPGEAWTKAVGEPPEVTQKKLSAYRDHIMDLTLPADSKQTAEVAITPLPASADDVLLDGQLLKRGVAAERKAATLARIRAETDRHPSDRLADLVRARAEIDLGDVAAAEPRLARLLAQDPDDVEARLLQATARMTSGLAARQPGERLALYRQASQILGPALKAHPHDYRLLYAYAVSRSAEPDFPSDNMLLALENAVDLAPQVADFRFAAAGSLAKRGRYADAIAIIQVLTQDPHSAARAKAARDMVDRFKVELAKADQGPSTSRP